MRAKLPAAIGSRIAVFLGLIALVALAAAGASCALAERRNAQTETLMHEARSAPLIERMRAGVYAVVMESRGLLRSRPSGLRKVEFATTPEGKRVYHRVLKIALERENALLSDFTATERTILIRLLHRMLDNLPSVSEVSRLAESDEKPETRKGN